MKSNSILFVGCGDLGCRSGAILLDNGWQVAGLRRDPSRLPPGFDGIARDYTRPADLDVIARLQPDYVVATCNPSDRSEDGYRRGFTRAAENLLAGMGSHRPRGILWISSTRVYAESDGGWVDEDSALATQDLRARAMIAAEQVLLGSPHRASVIRFAGIYGDPGGRLLERIRRGELGPRQPPRFSNRIHRDDCAGFLCHLLYRLRSGAGVDPVYNGVDDLPSLQFEVEAWLAAETGSPMKTAGDLQFPQASGANTRTTGHKRCSNRLLHASGYNLVYPDYRAGYRAVLASERIHPPPHRDGPDAR